MTVFVIYAANNCHTTIEQTLFDRDPAKRTDFVFLAYQFDPDMIRNKGLEFDRTEKWSFHIRPFRPATGSQTAAAMEKGCNTKLE